MRSRIPLLTAATVLALGACDSSRPLAPIENEPLLLIGGSPLQPLLHDPLQVDLWSWADPKTSEVSYAVTIEFQVREDLFQNTADPNMRLIGSPYFRTVSGKTIVQAGPAKVALSSVDPLAGDTDGYALVVIAVPLSDRQSRALEAALGQGLVELEVVTDLVTTAKDGSDDILDSLGALLLADPRPSPLPIPDEFFN